MGFPSGLVVKNPLAKARHMGLIPGVKKMLWRRKWQLTPVFLPRKSYEQMSLASYSPWGCNRVRHDLETKNQ